jgi:uncharacterized RmlC-like cupin family protein
VPDALPVSRTPVRAPVRQGGRCEAIPPRPGGRNRGEAQTTEGVEGLAKFLHIDEIPTDTVYEKGLAIDFGINDQTCGARRLTMGHTIIPAGSRNMRHYHANSEAGMYIIRGRLRILIGPEPDIQEYEVGPGTFCYVPQGEIHGIVNLSDTEDAELVFAYGGVPNKEASGTTFVEGEDVVVRHQQLHRRAG